MIACPVHFSLVRKVDLDIIDQKVERLWYQSHPSGKIDSLGSAFHLQLAEQVVSMGLHRADGQKKFVGNFLVAHALGHEVKHFKLPAANL